MKRIDVVLQMRESGAIPLYYNPDLDVMKKVISACYRGGMKIFEFTNRGDLAHELFAELVKWSKKLCPILFWGLEPSWMPEPVHSISRWVQNLLSLPY